MKTIEPVDTLHQPFTRKDARKAHPLKFQSWWAWLRKQRLITKASNKKRPYQWKVT